MIDRCDRWVLFNIIIPATICVIAGLLITFNFEIIGDFVVKHIAVILKSILGVVIGSLFMIAYLSIRYKL